MKEENMIKKGKGQSKREEWKKDFIQKKGKEMKFQSWPREEEKRRMK